MAKVILATGDGKLADELKGLLEELGHTFAGVVPRDDTLLESVLSRGAEVLLYDAADEMGSFPTVIPGVTILTLHDAVADNDADRPNPYRLAKPLERQELKFKLECAAYDGAETTATPPSLSQYGETGLSEDWFRTLYEYAPDAYYIMDLSGVFVDGNHACEDLTGYKREELVGRSFIKTKILALGQIAKAVRLYQQNKKGKSTGPDEFVFNRKSGGRVPIEIRTHPIRTGGRDLVLGIARDISKRKQAEEGLRNSEARFRSMFELSPESITLLDRSGRVITTNGKIQEWLGYDPEEIIGKRLSDLPILTKLGLLQVLRRFRKRIRGQNVPPYEAEFLNREGRKVYGRITASPIRDDKGEVSSVLVLISDVTERKHAEEELRTSRDFLDSILNGMHDAVAVIGPDYRIRQVNDSYLRTYGGSREELPGKTCHETTHGLEKPCSEGCHLDKVCKTGKPKTFVHTHKNVHGEEISVEISLFPLQNSEGKVEAVVEMEHDITEQRRIAEALREERDRVQTYLDIAGTIILALDTQGRVTLINQKGCEVLGHPEEQILGKSWTLNFIPEWTQERVEYTFKRLMAGEVDPLKYVEYYILTRDGKMRLIAWNNTVFNDEAGRVMGILSSGEDITDRRLAETALRESEEKFRTFFENEPEYCYIVSTGGVILDVNRAALDTLGYRKEALLGAPLKRIYAPESHAKIDQLIGQLGETGGLHDEELTIQTKDGRKRYVLLSATAVYDRDGNPVHSISVQRDITERKLAVAALHESEEKYRNLVERANDGIVIIQDEVLRYVNRRMTELVGYESEGMLGTAFTDYMVPEVRETTLEMYKNRIAGENVPSVYETMLLHKKGRRMMVEVNAGLITYEGRPADLVFLHDITQRKEAEIALRESEAKLKATLDALPDLLFEVDRGGKIYDFRTPDASTLYATPEHFLGKTVDQVIPAEAARVITDALAQAAETGSHHGAVYVLNMPDGPRWFELSVAAKGDPKAPEGRLIVTSREVTENKKAEEALRLSEEKYRFLFEGSPTLNLIIGLDGTLIDSNITALKEFGYTREEVQGRNAMEFVVPGDQELIAGLLEKSYMGEDTPEIDAGIIAKDGSVRTILFSRGNVVLTEDDQPVSIVVNGIDITERKKTEELIKKALREKEVLLKEIHHRVKNNLQIISSLLNLEAGKTQDEQVQDIISTSQNRIKSMALIHEKLYQSKELSRVDFPGYIQSLLDSLLLSYTNGSRTVSSELDLSPLYLDISTAIPLALIINELVSNSLEHAFQDGRRGVITIGLKEVGDGNYTLSIADDGVGIQGTLDLKKTKTLGLQLVNMLTQQIGAVIEMGRGSRPKGKTGAEFRITFSEKAPQTAHET